MPRSWSQEQKDEQSIRVKKYWSEHSHPRRGVHHTSEAIERMKKPKHRGQVLGHCEQCKRPLYNPESARRGYGKLCAGLSTISRNAT